MKTHNSKTSLFLMELIMVILVFSVCSAVSLRIFTKAVSMSRESANLNGSALAVETLAECFKETGDIEEVMKITGGNCSDERLTVMYDENWKATDDTEAPFYAVVEVKGKKALICAYSSETKEEIFSVETVYIGGGI